VKKRKLTDRIKKQEKERERERETERDRERQREEGREEREASEDIPDKTDRLMSLLPPLEFELAELAMAKRGSGISEAVERKRLSRLGEEAMGEVPKEAGKSEGLRLPPMLPAEVSWKVDMRLRTRRTAKPAWQQRERERKRERQCVCA